MPKVNKFHIFTINFKFVFKFDHDKAGTIAEDEGSRGD
jgi:hypothetical protein